MSEGSDGDSGQTESTASRWWLTNDILAFGLVASLIAVVLAHLGTSLNLQTFPQEVLYLYSFSVASAVAWAFGKDAVEAWRGGK